MRDRDFFELEDKVRKLEQRVAKLEPAAPVPGPGSGAGMLPGQRCTAIAGHLTARPHEHFPAEAANWRTFVGDFEQCPYVQPNPGSGMEPPPASPCAEWCGTVDGCKGQVAGECFKLEADVNCYCTPACRNAGRPLSPPTPERKP